MTTIDESSGPAPTGGASVVENHRGIRIGQALASGAVIDHRGVHIGQVADDGIAVDHCGVQIGRIRLNR